MRRDADPVRVSRVVGEMIAAGGWREMLAAGRLKSAWPEVVGEQIAAHSEPVRLTGGVLLVRAESGAWATELALLGRRISGLADEWLGGGLVREVKVVAGA